MPQDNSQPVPVLFACHTLGAGGTERQMTEMAKHLDRNRFEPHVMAFYPEGFRADELRAAGVPVAPLPVRSLRDASALRGALALRRYLRQHNIGIVHPFDYPSVTFMTPLARWFGVPVVLGSSRGERALFPPFYQRALRWTDRIADGIVVNSPFCAEELIRDYGVPRERIHLAPNGVDTARFQPGPRQRPEALAAAFGARVESAFGARVESALVIGTVSVLRREKSIETLIDAFSLAAGRHPDWRLLIAGGGEHEPILRRRAAALEAAGRCVFLPASPDVTPYYRALDIFVLPSLSEAFSNALLEAMASGVCAVASSAGGNPYILRHGDNGYLFPPGDSAALASRLEQLGADETLRRRLALAARQEVEQRYSLIAAADRLGEIYTGFLTK
jgi:glycosyltransferase involved in cell wall biosynthesis